MKKNLTLFSAEHLSYIISEKQKVYVLKRQSGLKVFLQDILPLAVQAPLSASG